MFKFGEIQIASREFNTKYQLTKDMDLKKIRLSEGVTANKHDTRYTIGYEKEPGEIVPLYIKTPKDCISPGVSQYNESAPWKMGFNVSEEKARIEKYWGICGKVEELLEGKKLEGEPLNNGRYINPKLITWDGEITTMFKGDSRGKSKKIGSCYATGVLKIGSVYRKGSNYHLQVFLRECKYRKRESSFESLLSSDEDEDGCDTVL